MELEHWVPLEAAEVSLRFFERHLPHTSHHVVASFLKRLNKVRFILSDSAYSIIIRLAHFLFHILMKVWRSAERKKIKRVKSEYEATIVDLKRQLLQSKYVQTMM